MQVQRPIFTNNVIHPTRVVTIREVREGLDASRSLSKSQRGEYLNSLGIDFENTEKYLETVERFEKAIEPPPLPNMYTRLYEMHIAFVNLYKTM